MKNEDGIPGQAADSAGLEVTKDSTYSWYVVYLLTFAYTVAFIDRQVLNLLVDPIRADLLLSDVHISLLQGFAFMFAYVLFGPVFGRMVDNGGRRNVLVLGVSLWSLFTVLCGTSDSYWELFLYRSGVGAAEACLAPAGWSLIADYFSKERLPRAMSIYMLGPSLGAGLALVAGGAVISSVMHLTAWFPFLEGYSVWQVTFIMVGFPGFLLALWLLTIKEPPRTGSLSSDALEKFSFRELIDFFWKNREFYSYFFVGMSLIAIVVYGFPTWMPAYLMRNFGAEASVVGFQYGVQVLLVGALGIYLGPSLEKWLRIRGNMDSPVSSAFYCAVAILVCVCLLPFAPSYRASLIVAALVNFFYALPQAIAASALQIATPNRLRGVVVAVYYFLISVFGLGIAPSLIAVATEHLFGAPEKVGSSLALVCGVSALLATWSLYKARNAYLKMIGAN